MNFTAIALATLLGLILWYMHRKHRCLIGVQRRAMFDDCLDLFESARITQDDVDFPVLVGRFKGHSIKLKPVPDYMVFRKIPSLWLLATVHSPIPYRAALDFLMRPQNVEFYSPSSTLTTQIFPNPPGWPREATLRTDDREHMPPIKRITPHMGLFDDPKTKELLITPRGVRIVYQADQARRAHYMVLRQQIFDNIRVQPALIRKLLNRAVAICEDLGRDNDDDSEKQLSIAGERRG